MLAVSGLVGTVPSASIPATTVRLREIGTPLIGTILEFASGPLKKIGTRLLGFQVTQIISPSFGHAVTQ